MFKVGDKVKELEGIEKAEAIRKQGYYYDPNGNKKEWEMTIIMSHCVTINSSDGQLNDVDDCHLEKPIKRCPECGRKIKNDKRRDA